MITRVLNSTMLQARNHQFWAALDIRGRIWSCWMCPYKRSYATITETARLTPEASKSSTVITKLKVLTAIEIGITGVQLILASMMSWLAWLCE